MTKQAVLGDRMPPFDYSQDFEQIDFRRQPEKYRVGKGEQGVLLVEPYKSEILPHWRIRTPEIARVSSTTSTWAPEKTPIMRA